MPGRPGPGLGSSPPPDPPAWRTRVTDAVARSQLVDVAALLDEILADDALGIYLFGSAVSGGLRPASDLDVLVLTKRPTTAAERRILAERLIGLSGRRHPSPAARSLDVAIVVRSAIQPWHHPPPLDFQYGDWLRADFLAGDPRPWHSPNPDLTTLLAMARSSAVPLAGPPITALVDAIPDHDLVAAVVEGIDALVAEADTDERNVVLTLARVWVTVVTGELVPKDVAADWAMPRLPAVHRPVLARARAIYAGEERERWDDLRAALRAHVAHVVGEIRQAAAAVEPARSCNEDLAPEA
ncbi:MAG TPA: aminoglycoside adenylyltransferase family protein [Candidatus Limnocylindrales bacterium]|nr:aminoglycoside adenylyltransferase family protein [Candidatus Limnocylindrales bacterium]